MRNWELVLEINALCTYVSLYYIMFCAILLVFVCQRTRGIANMCQCGLRSEVRMYVCIPAPVCIYISTQCEKTAKRRIIDRRYSRKMYVYIDVWTLCGKSEKLQLVMCRYFTVCTYIYTYQFIILYTYIKR